MHPKTSLQQQRFQQYKETTGYRYVYQFLCQNPDKDTWKWKTRGGTAEKKSCMYIILHIFCATCRCFSTMPQMESRGAQTACWPWSDCHSLQETWESDRIWATGEASYKKNKDLPIFLSSNSKRLFFFNILGGLCEALIENSKRNRENVIPKGKMVGSLKKSPSSTRDFGLQWNPCGYWNSMKLLFFNGPNDHPVFHFPHERVLLVKKKHLKSVSRWSHAINYLNASNDAPQRSAEPQNSPWHWDLLEGDR